MLFKRINVLALKKNFINSVFYNGLAHYHRQAFSINTWLLISWCSKLVDIIVFRISQYALAHSFAHKHRFHRSRSPLCSLFKLCFWTKYGTHSYPLILNTYLTHTVKFIIGCLSAQHSVRVVEQGLFHLLNRQFIHFGQFGNDQGYVGWLIALPTIGCWG